MPTRLPARVLARLILIAALIVGPVSGLAGPGTPALASIDSTCQMRSGTLTPFTRWGDRHHYFTLVGGQFERSPVAVGWTLSGGARIVPGNEPWDAVAGTDAKSLRIPASGSATTPWFCVHPNEPTVRFFVKAPGSRGSTLTVTMTGYFQAAPGAPYGASPTTTTATLDGTPAGWAVTPILALPQRAGATGTMVSVTMAASGGSWQIDDVEVDPWKTR